MEKTDPEKLALADLDAFSRALTHDLRSPLMGLSGLLQVLEEDHAASLDETGQRYLSMVRESTRDLTRIIDSLVALAKISQGTLERAPVDLAALARTEHARRATLEPMRAVELIIDPALPVPQGDRPRLRMLMEHLLGNAWKFTSKQPRARIEFGSSPEGYFLRDDGVGFDMNGVGRLFTLFQRLHTADEFDGRGVGLASARQIVHRHGGRIWAESAGKGATIRFTLPG